MKRTRTGAMLPAVIMIVALFAIFTSVLRMWQINKWNATLRESFVAAPAADSAYRYDSGDEALMAEFTLKHDVEYYDSPNGNIVLIIQTGSYLRPDLYDASNDLYGWCSMPTDVKGWRLTRLFPGEADRTANGECYVKLSDLQQMAKDAYGDSAKDMLDVVFKPYGSDTEIARTFTRAEYETLRADFDLYEKGIMCSSDLEAPIWTTQTTFGFVVGIALCLWAVVMFILRSREGGKAK